MRCAEVFLVSSNTFETWWYSRIGRRAFRKNARKGGNHLHFKKHASKEGAPAARNFSLSESIRTFAAAVGTTAVLMLTVCGVFGLYTETAAPAAAAEVRAASVFGESTAAAERRTVQLGGDVFGIRLFSDGVIVASLTDIYADGGACCPARDAGIEPGDYVVSADGEAITENNRLAEILSEGGDVALQLRRDDALYTTVLSPAHVDGTYKAGMWIRDSAAGLGTVTFYSADGASFAALGHGICDADTKDVLSMRSGEPAAITICGIERSQSGSPGRLRGFFSANDALGTLLQNDETGIYGTVDTPLERETVSVAERSAVHKGAAQIVATIDGSGVQRFDAEIERIAGDKETKSLVVRVTDSYLLATTGGIVQGMSGCPILQDGKLAGAVTHVFVDDPTRGYGIFAETMLKKSIAISDS